MLACPCRAYVIIWLTFDLVLVFLSKLIDWLEFNGTFSTVRLYRAFISTYSLRFGT